MLVDSHAHLDFYEDPAPILARARAAGITRMLAIGIGEGPATMHRALMFAQAHPDVFASVGIHPQQAQEATPDALRRLSELAQDPRCIAVGEIGLDYYHLGNPEIAVQQRAFADQVDIAIALGKPILIHCRTSELATPAARAKYGAADAFDDILNSLDARWTKHGIPGVMHCFSGTSAQAERALAAGLYLSFAGNLTYPRSTVIQRVASAAPADRILVETDCPFLTPTPHRGQLNEPALMVHTVAFLAELRGLTPDALAALTTANFDRLFPNTAPGASLL